MGRCRTSGQKPSSYIRFFCVQTTVTERLADGNHLFSVTGRAARFGSLAISAEKPHGMGRVTETAAPGYSSTSKGAGIAVGTPITGRPPHRTVRAAFPHTAP